MPYLNWDTSAAVKNRVRVIEKRKAQQDWFPIDKDVFESCDVEPKILWYFFDSGGILPYRRTLGQYESPDRQDTTALTERSILYKLYTRNGFHYNGIQILVVDQLWLWVLDPQRVVSIFSSAGEPRDVDWQTRDVHQHMANDIAFKHPATDAFDVAALAVKNAVIVALGEKFAEFPDRENRHIFSLYRKTLRELQDKHADMYTSYRNNNQLDRLDHMRETQGDSESEDDLSAIFDLGQIEYYLMEMKDLDEEIKIILKIIGTQKDCVKLLQNRYQDLVRLGRSILGSKLLEEAHQALNEYGDQLNAIRRDGEAITSSFRVLLTMRQQHVKIEEAVLARRESVLARRSAEAATAQPRSILVFTVFTVIFLPLSFFTSLFGMNAREWSGQETDPNLTTILVIMIIIPILVTILALSLAFSSAVRRKMRTIWKKVWAFWGTNLTFGATKDGQASNDRTSRLHIWQTSLRLPWKAVRKLWRWIGRTCRKSKHPAAQDDGSEGHSLETRDT